jgi:pseudoazurin
MHVRVARRPLIGLALISTLPAGFAHAAEHTVRMVDRGPDGTAMVYDPAFIRVAVGDSVVFQSTNPGHNAQTLTGAWPDGVPQLRGRIGQTVTLNCTAPGIYGILCLPHTANGMVGLVLAGDPVNLEAARAARVPAGRARQNWEALLAQVNA